MFEIKNENQNGIFHVKLNRNLSSKEIIEIAQIAANVVGNIQSDSSSIGTITPMEDNPSFTGQSKLGERPVNKINMGDYVEPDTGVRIRMLAFPETNKVQAIKSMREITKISIVGCRDILYGNYKSPVFPRPMGLAVLEKLKEFGIYASLVDDQCRVELE
jgi:ribosomal protein L7/L12